ILVFLLKVGVLVGIAVYARRQAQLADELAAQDAIALIDTAGRAVTLPQGTRLTVAGKLDGATPAFDAVSRDGSHFRIPLTDVQDAATREKRPLALLPGFRSVLAGLEWRWLLFAFLLFGPPLFMMAVRWWILLAASGIDVPFFTLVRLHYLGFFFNTFMPGGAGGDVIKAVYLTRHCQKKAEAATIVVVDRVVGLMGLLALAGAVVIVQPAMRKGVAAPIAALAIAMTMGFALFFSPGFRKVVRYEALLMRLPRAEVLARIDAALYGLRHRAGALAAALGLTVILQLLEVIAVSFAGRSLSLDHARFSHYLAFVPIGYVVNALPISFGGVGLMEGAFLALFRDAGAATATQGFMLGVVARLLVIGWGLLGAVSALFPPDGSRMSPE
ncbi:MAG TPA: lysylphosphatidylglycerol synthase transmembrane domain-containing protein, partial [Polyangiaceae bacterium]